MENLSTLQKLEHFIKTINKLNFLENAYLLNGHGSFRPTLFSFGIGTLSSKFPSLLVLKCIFIPIAACLHSS
jgi:hypothetical protein